MIDAGDEQKEIEIKLLKSSEIKKLKKLGIELEEANENESIDKIDEVLPEYVKGIDVKEDYFVTKMNAFDSILKVNIPSYEEFKKKRAIK